MQITRRQLSMAGALVLGGLNLWPSTSATAASADEEAVAQAVEALRKAIFEQAKPQLEALCSDKLSYGHSGGRVETKAEFIEAVMTRKTVVKSITLSEHTIAVIGTEAIARHTWESVSEADGKTTNTKIGVLQVWKKHDNAWKLLARQGFRTQPAT